VVDLCWIGIVVDIWIVYCSGCDLCVIVGDGSGVSDYVVVCNVVLIVLVWWLMFDFKFLVGMFFGFYVFIYVDGFGYLCSVNVDIGECVLLLLSDYWWFDIEFLVIFIVGFEDWVLVFDGL